MHKTLISLIIISLVASPVLAKTHSHKPHPKPVHVAKPPPGPTRYVVLEVHNDAPPFRSALNFKISPLWKSVHHLPIGVTGPADGAYDIRVFKVPQAADETLSLQATLHAGHRTLTSNCTVPTYDALGQYSGLQTVSSLDLPPTPNAQGNYVLVGIQGDSHYFSCGAAVQPLSTWEVPHNYTQPTQ